MITGPAVCARCPGPDRIREESERIRTENRALAATERTVGSHAAALEKVVRSKVSDQAIRGFDAQSNMFRSLSESLLPQMGAVHAAFQASGASSAAFAELGKAAQTMQSCRDRRSARAAAPGACRRRYP